MVVLVQCLAMKNQHIETRFDLYFLVLFIILAIGIPLVFTSLTRSVFEVNKMLLLRIVTILMLGGWIVRSTLRHARGDTGTGKSIAFGALRWDRIGLELPIGLFVGMNLISTIFSQNPRLSVIGAYDRWEGIFTVLGYVLLLVMSAKLVRMRYQLKWIVFALIVPAALSGIYGIAQSLGYDFMQWSVDPTKRVFACINNPVHFCAYMGMMVPLGISALLYLNRDGKRALFSWVNAAMLVMIGIIYYGMYLSFSRATWFGFALSMPVFFLVILGLMRTDSIKRFLPDFFVTLVGIIAFYMYYIFGFHEKSIWVAIGIGVISALALAHSVWVNRDVSDGSGRSWRSQILRMVFGTFAIFFAFVYPWSDLSFSVAWALRLMCIGLVALTVYNPSKAVSDYFARLVVLVLFATLQFVAISFTNISLFTILLGVFYWTTLRGNQLLLRQNKRLIFLIMIAFALFTAVPAIPSLYQSTFQAQATGVDDGLGAVENVQSKLDAYKKDAQNGSARVSMWKSSIPWIKKYWLIGSGLDTIKYMYPDFRRSDYGILEGGHNFTPDRLHNEYLNNFATRGIFATLLYYFGVILGWYILVLRGIVKLHRSPLKYFVMAFMTGVTVYLGQVLFNFGVVATLALFYLFMGLAWAMVVHGDFEQEEQGDSQS